MDDNRRNHLLFAVQIALNALSGYAFAKVLALRFGTSALKDGFDIAYSVPFIVLNVSGFLFVHAVVSTHFARMLATRPERVESLFSAVLSWMLAFSLALMTCCAVFSRELTAILGPGLLPEVKIETERLILMLLPLVPALGISTYLSAVLTAYAVPMAMEFCQLIARCGAIAYIVFCGSGFELADVAVGLIASSLVGLAVEWAVLARSTQLRFRLKFSCKEPEFGVIMRQGAGFLLVAIAAQASWAYMRRLATLDGIGTNAAVTYAMAIISPVSLLLGKPLALTLGPQFAKHFARGHTGLAYSALVRTVLACLAVSMLVACSVTVFAVPLIRTLFGGGRFDYEAVQVTAGLCRVFVWGLPGVVINLVILMPILTMRGTQLPAIVLGAGYIVHLLATAVLFRAFGKHGLAYGYVAYVTLQAILGGVLLVRSLQSPGLQIAGAVSRGLDNGGFEPVRGVPPPG